MRNLNKFSISIVDVELGGCAELSSFNEIHRQGEPTLMLKQGGALERK